MPYKRYDIVNKYNYRGKKVNEHVRLKMFFLFFIPVLIILIVLLGIFLSYRSQVGPVFGEPSDVSTPDQVVVIDEDELLRVVNRHKPLEEDYVPELVTYDDIQVSPLMYEDLTKLMDDASAAGISLTVESGYVSYADQDLLYQNLYNQIKASGDYTEVNLELETRKQCPKAGCSESQTGLLISFGTNEEVDSFEKSEASSWLEKNSVNYGFILRYPNEENVSSEIAYKPDTYRYVGTEHALNIRKYDMTLDEYVTHISQR